MYVTSTIKITSLANTSTEIIPFLHVIVATLGHLHLAEDDSYSML